MTRYEIAQSKRKSESDKRIKAIQAKTNRMMLRVHAKGYCSKELLDSMNTVYYF